MSERPQTDVGDALLTALLRAEYAEQDSWRAFAVVTRLSKLLGVWEESWRAGSMAEVGDMLCAALAARLAAPVRLAVWDNATEPDEAVEINLLPGERLVFGDHFYSVALWQQDGSGYATRRVGAAPPAWPGETDRG